MRIMGFPTILTPSEEFSLYNWTNVNALIKKLPLGKQMLLGDYTRNICRWVPVNENKPGDSWFKDF